MRGISGFIFLLFSLTGFSQNNREIFLQGSYQFYDAHAISIGVGTKTEAIWPKLNFDSFIETSLDGILFLNQPDNQDIYGIQTGLSLSSKFVGVGIDFRLLLQENLSRFDCGPAIKVGYKFIWLGYRPSFLIYNNFFKNNSDTVTMDFDTVEHNIYLTVSIPIVKRF